MTYKKHIHLALILVLAGAAWARAADSLLVEAPAVVMAGDTNLTLRVHSLEGGKPSPAREEVVFSGLPRGMELRGVGAGGRFSVQGDATLNLSVGADTPPGPVTVKVASRADPAVSYAFTVLVESPVRSFRLVPRDLPGPGREGDPFRFQVFALDGSGAVVTSYKDAVDLRAAHGEATPAVVPGEAFDKGVADFDVRFSAADPLTRLNRLEAQARVLYGGQTQRAAGAIELTVRPGEAP